MENGSPKLETWMGKVEQQLSLTEGHRAMSESETKKLLKLYTL